MDLQDFKIGTIPVHAINDSLLKRSQINLSLLRTDLIHPELSGNKWFKLKYNLLAAKTQGIDTILSFGGAWSNHLHALSAAGRLFGFKTIGLIRGEVGEPLNACLQDAVDNGMTLYPVSREAYRQKHQPCFIKELSKQFGEFHLVPEGGTNELGINGVAEILDNIDITSYQTIALACGTGTTLAGVISANTFNPIAEEDRANSSVPEVLGFQVLKGEGYLQAEVQQLIHQFKISDTCQWSINDEFHFGGYGRISPELIKFCSEFTENSSIPIEPVYSGKMLFGLYNLIKRDFFPQNSSILAIHGGGLQGRRGFDI
jgi:1-aminocyclopropane-1-carboxylate deaminase